ncbi:hypothetical protein CYLTODRAFT_459839 [Cylindrobasidium torrendii FP15055 ss-10]|uniref:Uncharacterized protein n=1 Tax=Cylindrobasidium torrendii FP15055 ss-10 TaxID=1314674 RepID=A0A0D7ATD2_9AGAR|nr:hypothetical protein CYLTODRAFT_459839 [Cylindrobasidium torrendii FP15055 ss-10]
MAPTTRNGPRSKLIERRPRDQTSAPRAAAAAAATPTRTLNAAERKRIIEARRLREAEEKAQKDAASGNRYISQITLK